MRRSYFIFAVLTLCLYGCAHPARMTATAPEALPASCARKPLHVTFLGDSLAKGWGARDPRNTFTSRVFAFIQKQRPDSSMANISAPGLTSDEIAEHLIPYVHRAPCSLIVVVAGANDVQKYYTPAHFARSYDHLLHEVRTRVPMSAVVVTGLPDIALSPRIPRVTKFIISRLSEKDNEAILSTAAQYRAATVDLYTLSLREAARKNTLLSDDGIHPNDDGYKLMAAAAYPVVEDLIRASVKKAR